MSVKPTQNRLSHAKSMCRAVKSADTFPGGLLDWFVRELVAASADQMPQAMAAKSVAEPSKNTLSDQHQSSDADAEMAMAIRTQQKTSLRSRHTRE